MSNFIRTSPVAAESFHADRRTDKTKVNSRFAQFYERV